MNFSKAVVKYRIPILILTLVLVVPSVMGMAATRINYDMLNYLPEDMDTVIGQNELLDEFGKGAFSFIIVEDMAAKGEAAEGALRAKMVKTVPSKPISGYILQVATGARQVAEKAEMPQLPPVIFAVSYFQVVEVEGEVWEAFVA